MDEGTRGIFVLVLTSLVVAAITHRRVRSFWLACLVSAAASSVVFNILATIQQGHSDKFFLVALVFGGFYAFIISAVAGLPFILSGEEKEGRVRAIAMPDDSSDRTRNEQACYLRHR